MTLTPAHTCTCLFSYPCVSPCKHTHSHTHPLPPLPPHRYISDCQLITACSSCEFSKVQLGRPCGCDEATSVYKEVSETYFREIWAKHHTNCQIRKHMRFSKCSFCVKWRCAKHDRRKTKAERYEAKDLLNGHYGWVTRERSEELRKVWLGLLWLFHRCLVVSSMSFLRFFVVFRSLVTPFTCTHETPSISATSQS
jgi:hypothetical protein